MRRFSTSGRRGVLLPAATAVVLALTGGGLVATGLAAARNDAAPTAGRRAPATEPVTVPAGPTASPAPLPSGPDASFGPSLTRAAPVGLEIPTIGVRSNRIVPLGRRKNGTLEVPKDYALPGWYTPGSSPGQFGPAVIAGHVDSHRGPAVFYRLRELKRGAVVKVRRMDGQIAVFTVDAVEQFPKNRFPTVRVYGNTTNRAELRLITCGGAFDDAARSYRDNIVVYAHLTAVEPG